jgi:hypothetical protein
MIPKIKRKNFFSLSAIKFEMSEKKNVEVE